MLPKENKNNYSCFLMKLVKYEHTYAIQALGTRFQHNLKTILRNDLYVREDERIYWNHNFGLIERTERWVD